MKILLIALFIPFKILSQDSVVYYLNDTMMGRTIIEGNFWINDSYTCEKLDNTWYYYRADTMYQKIEWRHDGHQYFILENNEWVPHINCVIYDTPTSYNIKTTSDLILYSKDLSAYIRSDKPMGNIMVYSIDGVLIESISPFSNYVSISFNRSGVYLFAIDGGSYKLLI